MKLTPALVFTLTALTAAVTPTPAAVIVVAPTAVSPGSFQITDDVLFTINVGGNAQAFVMDEWVVSDGNQSESTIAPDLAVSINGGAPVTRSGFLSDNVTGFVGALTPNDGYLFANTGFSLSPGNTLLLKAGLYSLAATGSFNPQTTQTFTGNMFVADFHGIRMSPNVQVPEPTALGLLGLGSLALLRRRRGSAAC